MRCWTLAIKEGPKKRIIAASIPPSIMPKELAGLTIQSKSGNHSK
ncbi:hypothetical protein [Nostoc sp.]